VERREKYDACHHLVDTCRVKASTSTHANFGPG
jgi:hypothetical protein